MLLTWKKKEEKKTKIREKKETRNVKHAIKSDQLIHLTMSSVFGTDEPGRQWERWENLFEPFLQIIYWVDPNMLKQ